MVSISEKLNLKPQLSGADIKSLYEAEADTNAFTDAEKTSVSTALQPDQAETISGNYTFNGALILPNNSRINGTEHFYQTAKPTVRGDSSALVPGDRWYKTDEGTEWFWNGTYWLSALITNNLVNFTSNDFGANISAAPTGFINMPPDDLLIKEVRFKLYSNGHLVNTTSVNHLIISIAPLVNTANFGTTWATYNVWSGDGDIIGRTWAGYTSIGDYPVTIPLGNRFVVGSKTLSTFPTINQFRGLRFTASVVGTNPGGNLVLNSAIITYHLIYA